MAMSYTTIVVGVLLLAVCQQAAAQCKAGDNSCWCRVTGGTWKTLKAPFIPTCTFTFQHQGVSRTANVYFPPGYTRSKSYPTWIQLHGNFWVAMLNPADQAGWNPNAADVTPKWDQVVGTKIGNNAIMVYPQSTGDPKSKQFWNTIFWQCSLGICIDKRVDDVGFLDKVVAQLPQRLGSSKVFLSGTSAGGMMVFTYLCKSAVAQSKVAAAAAILGAMATDFKKQCQKPTAVPLIMINGLRDEHLPFNQGVLFEWIDFMSTVSTSAHFISRQGLAGVSPVITTTSELKCSEYQPKGSSTSKPGRKSFTLCAVLNAGHSTDQPYPGFMFETARNFFKRF